MDKHYIMAVDVNLTDYVFDTDVIAPDTNSEEQYFQEHLMVMDIAFTT